MDNQLNFRYDRKADVLYVSSGHPEFTDYVELDDNFILRLDPQTKKIVGFTIIDFAAHFAQKDLPVSVPLRATFERTKKPRRSRTFAESKAIYRTGQARSNVRRSK